MRNVHTQTATYSRFSCVGRSWRGARKVFAIKFTRTHDRLKITARAWSAWSAGLRLHSHPNSANRKQVACGKCASKTKCAGLMAGHRLFSSNRNVNRLRRADCGTYFEFCQHESPPRLAIIIFLLFSIWENHLLFAVRPWIHEWNHRAFFCVRWTVYDGMSHDNWRRNGTGNCVTLPFIEILVSHSHPDVRSLFYGRQLLPSDECIAPRDAHAYDLMQWMCSTYFYAFKSPCSSAQFTISDLSGFVGNRPSTFSHIFSLSGDGFIA